jgi:hypothetical protein
MPTENPKISAYVPQVVYDRFKQFQEERGLSMSQAAIEVFAEYFGINLADSSTKENTGGLLDRMLQLEQLVADLKQSYVYLSQKVDFIQSTGELPKFELNGNSVDIQSKPSSNLPEENLVSELPSIPKDELPIIKALNGQQSSPSDDSITPSKPTSEPSNLLSHQLEIVESTENESNNLLSNPPSEPDIKINYAVLAQRLGATEGYVKNKKATSTTEEFTKWSTKKDPDKISWQSIKQGKNVYYCPVGNLSDEQKANLQDWLRKNQNTVE